ncbi:kinase-like domain-containing protein [Nemania sp. FL0916]|nr:kinase-like domain-containing protein [Nemania sp. FL0916]
MASPYVPPENHRKTQHNGTEHLAINNTFFCRFVTRLALHTTAKFHTREGVCVPISKTKIVKAGWRVHLTEGATMKYIAENTSIPVPEVHCSFVHNNIAYIVMERIQGEELPKAIRNMSQEALESVLAQLRGMVQELRSLTPPPGTGVESCVGGSLHDCRLPRGNPRFGPFKTIQEFHKWLRHDFEMDDAKDREIDQDWHDVAKMIRQQDGPWPPPKFAHGDLNPFNILIRDGKVAAIIDWEFAGWYPHYWEYTSAWFGNITKTGWRDMLNDKVLDRPQSEEFKMEETRHKWWGEW